MAGAFEAQHLVVEVEGLVAALGDQAGAILTNEFGERSFTFVAPDGYTFALVE